MGIKNLWSILTPYCERKPLYILSNKVVAIDLSGWICESLNVVDYFVHPRFYLRNLFFRTCYLLVTGITPVFVLEGTAPSLKYGVILKRNQLQFRGARPKNVADCDDNNKKDDLNKKEQKRNRFHYVLKQCEDLLKAMGIICVQGPGEAEAFCAYLNQEGLVDGVISQDSDCFAYGATRVFRNFSALANGGFVDIYDLKHIRESLDLSQEKIVIMGLLAGCDYCPNGVEGVGKEAVYKLIQMYPSKDIIERVKSWKTKAYNYTDLELKVDDKNICNNCGHQGHLQTHTRAGCRDCRMSLGCNSSLWKEKRLEIKAELDIRRKAIKDPQFPSQEILDEFLLRPCDLPPLDLEWKQPNLIKFIQNSSQLLQWDEIYCFQKFFLLFTRWQIIYLGKNKGKSLNIILNPDRIKKKRAPKGVASYEIVWKDENNIFTGLIPDQQLQSYIGVGNSLESLWSTIEPIDLVEIAYPDLHNEFVESKTKKTTKTKRNAKEKRNNTEKPQEKRKQKEPKSKTAKENLLTKFLVKNNVENNQPLMNSSLDNMHTLAEALDEIETKNGPLYAPRMSEEPTVRCSSLENLNDFLQTVHEIERNNEKDKTRDLKENSFDLAELERIGEDQCDSEDLDISGAINRICSQNYGKRMRLTESPSSQSKCWDLNADKLLETIHNCSIAFDDDDFISHISRRLLLKDDIIANNSANDSIFNASVRRNKRESFFFESIELPETAGSEQFVYNDMFECSLLLKDQMIVQLADDLNSTIIYDVDF